MTTELLSKIYYKDFPGLDALYKEAKHQNSKITYKDVKAFLKSTEEQQIFKRKPHKFFHLVSRLPFERVQIDLLDLNTYIPRNNNGYRYILLLIDTFTRYVFGVPIKTRSTDDIYDALTSIIKELQSEGFKISQIDCDNETGFNANKIVNYLEKQNIKQNFNNPNDHNALGTIDRFCRTFRELLNKYCNSRNTTRWFDYYDTLINGYNHRIHRSLKTSPLNAISNNQYWLSKITDQSTNDTTIKIGDTVRLLKQKTLFEKGTSDNYTKEIFKVIGYENGLYTVNNRQRKYKASELLPVNNNIITYKNDEEENKGESKDKQIQQYKHERTIKRRLNKESVVPANVVEEKRVRRQIDPGFFVRN